jgi:hypothetical protein
MSAERFKLVWPLLETPLAPSLSELGANASPMPLTPAQPLIGHVLVKLHDAQISVSYHFCYLQISKHQ